MQIYGTNPAFSGRKPARKPVKRDKKPLQNPNSNPPTKEEIQNDAWEKIKKGAPTKSLKDFKKEIGWK